MNKEALIIFSTSSGIAYFAVINHVFNEMYPHHNCYCFILTALCVTNHCREQPMVPVSVAIGTIITHFALL